MSDQPDYEEVFRKAGAEFGKTLGQMQAILAAQGAMGWAYRGDLATLRATLAVLPAGQVREISAAAALLASTADDVLTGGSADG
jgi:hypothetical protein